MMGPGLAVRRGDTKTKLITKTELGSVSRWRRKPRGGGGEIIAGAWRAAGPDTAAGGGLQSLRYTLLTSADAMAWIFRPKVHQKRLVETWVAGVPGPVGRSPGNIDIVTPLAWVL